jgi:chorismate-pyruvate lyase
MSVAPGIPDFEIDGLDLVQRILVTTDGTVTDVLAVAFLEPIALVKIDVTVAPAAGPVPPLELDAGATTMHRRIVLRGARTGTNYAYAEVSIAADRLSPALREDLLAGRVPLGQLWQMHRLETWKERPSVRTRAAGSLAAHLDLAPDAALIHRSYRTFTGGRPVFHVEEFFPTRYASPAR